jgi:RNA-directed DNA polymerase
MRDISYQTWIARGLARAMLADWRQQGGTRVAALRARAAVALGDNPPWLGLVISPLAALPLVCWEKMDVASLAQRIHDSLDIAFSEGAVPRIRHLILRTDTMRPRPMGLDHIALPDLPTIKDLSLWLDVPLERLQWLSPEIPIGADHYRYKLLPKQTGGLRLLEIPKADIKRIQRSIYMGLLRHVPVHEAAHGFVTNRSVATHAAEHVGQATLVKFDLQDFFGSIRKAQVAAICRTLGYPEGVANCLATLCTHRTADMVVERLREDGGLNWIGAKRLRSAHLPQGAPTSPALANLCAFNMDLRLEGLAWAFGAKYSRYADDLVFSGPAALKQQFRALHAWVAEIIRDEGFFLHPEKTRCVAQHQQQRITGVVVNVRPNTPRREFDRLKACLHQCVHQGPASQNTHQVDDFRGHLLGRIAWVKQFNAARAAKLMRLFEQIQW